MENGSRRKTSGSSERRTKSWPRSSRLTCAASSRRSVRHGWEERRSQPAQGCPPHEKLGSWCEQQGLKHEAIAHFTTAVQFDPYRDAAWKHLGYTKRHGRWLTREKIAEEEHEAAAQRKADRTWDTLLRKWKADLAENKRRQEAEESLAKVADPRAVASIVRVFASAGRATDQMRASTMLKGIETPEATKELARLAVFSDSPEVRETAINSLKKREPRDFVGFLIAMIPFSVEYKVQPVSGPGSQGAFLVDTPRFTMLRTYDAPPAFTLAESFRGTVTVDCDGMPIVYRGVDLDTMKFMNAQNQLLKMREVKERTAQLLNEADMKAAAAQQQLVADVGAIEQFNLQAAALLERVLPVLQQAAEAPASKTDQDGLFSWWYDRLGYSYQPPEKVRGVLNVFMPSTPPSLTTCFAAGTPVRTIEGFRPIEAIRPGDLVPSQDVATGEIDFRPIVIVHHNAPNQTLRITLSDDEILVASVYHRFWRSGKGWRRHASSSPATCCERSAAPCEWFRSSREPLSRSTISTSPRTGASSPATAACWCTTTRCPHAAGSFRRTAEF